MRTRIAGAVLIIGTALLLVIPIYASTYYHADSRAEALQEELLEESKMEWKTDYAILNDRVLMEEGKPQIYGTQIKMAATIVEDELAMQLCLWPVEYPAALDSLRSTVGLSPIEEYLKTSSESIGQEIVWDKEKTVADFD